MDIGRYPKTIASGSWRYGHCQGIAVDKGKGHIYFSFTTALIKTDLTGRLIGTVTGLLGHLGCIAFCEADGRVYGSLEYKRDAIGRGILQNAGSDAQIPDAFYIAIFNVDRIDRADMDACTDGVMTAVYLKTVVDDYSAVFEKDGRTLCHRHGCSGIDGVTFGCVPGDMSGPMRLFVAYGIYGDETREDNDDQVLLCFDTSDWARCERPLSQENMHRSGPDAPDAKYFVRTGNTRYGVQNLEYDADTGHFLMAVYRGGKEAFPNYDLYAVDGTKPPQGDRLFLLSNESDEEIPGWRFAYGATGLCSLGEGLYYISQESRDGALHSTVAALYRWDGETPFARIR